MDGQGVFEGPASPGGGGDGGGQELPRGWRGVRRGTEHGGQLVPALPIATDGRRSEIEADMDRRVAAVANAGISGSHIRDIMLEAVEDRFCGMRAATPVEMLSDNGSAYTARATRTFARQLGLKPCFTPVRSPQSNGISKAFVHTLKRDYVRVSPLPDALTALTSRAG